MCLEYCAVCPLGDFYQQVPISSTGRTSTACALLGAALIISFCTALLPAYLTFRSVGNVFSVHGYELHLSDTVNTTTLVLGISTLIVAEVFAIGLKMKEEQDLTI